VKQSGYLWLGHFYLVEEQFHNNIIINLLLFLNFQKKRIKKHEKHSLRNAIATTERTPKCWNKFLRTWFYSDVSANRHMGLETREKRKRVEGEKV